METTERVVAPQPPPAVPFENRRDAGRWLARALMAHHGDDIVVVGIAPGGVIVAAEVARELQAVLDVIVVRKVAAPARPGFIVGSIAPGVVRRDDELVREAGVSPRYLGFTTAHAAQEVNRAMELYRGRRHATPIEGRLVILVDDGFVTGLSAATAVESLRRRGPGRIVAASPMGTAAAIARLEAIADEVVCLETATCASPSAIAACYRRLEPVADDTVIESLQEASARSL